MDQALNDHLVSSLSTNCKHFLEQKHVLVDIIIIMQWSLVQQFGIIRCSGYNKLMKNKSLNQWISHKSMNELIDEE